MREIEAFMGNLKKELTEALESQLCYVLLPALAQQSEIDQLREADDIFSQHFHWLVVIQADSLH